MWGRTTHQSAHPQHLREGRRIIIPGVGDTVCLPMIAFYFLFAFYTASHLFLISRLYYGDKSLMKIVISCNTRSSTPFTLRSPFAFTLDKSSKNSHYLHSGHIVIALQHANQPYVSDFRYTANTCQLDQVIVGFGDLKKKKEKKSIKHSQPQPLMLPLFKKQICFRQNLFLTSMFECLKVSVFSSCGHICTFRPLPLSKRT